VVKIVLGKSRKIICKRCGKTVITKYGNQKYCKECSLIVRKEKLNEYVHNNWDKIYDQKKKLLHIPENRAKRRKVEKRYREKNRVKLDKYHKEWSIKNSTHLKEWQREYARTRKGKEIHNKSWRKRRATRMLIIEAFTMYEWLNKLEKTKGICPMCGKYVGIDKLTLDHIYPVSKAEIGRIYTIDDVQPLCKSCNSKKSSKWEK